MNTLKKPLTFIITLWIAHLLNFMSGYQLNEFGIVPRTLSGLIGIPLSPFLHGNWGHLISNTSVLFILSVLICLDSTKLWYTSLGFGTFIGGLFVWLFGATATHIGASIVIYALYGTIFGIGLFQKKIYYILISVILGLIYGMSFLWGLVPTAGISFSGHLGGLFAGFLCARLVKLESLEAPATSAPPDSTIS